MKTEAIVLREHGGPEVLVRETIDVPDPGPREVRVRVRAVALNHLDLWVRRGPPDLKLEYPHRLGADVVGEVEAIGPGARGATLGARVVVSPGVSCGVCARCLSGQDHLCRQYAILGEHTQGGYAQHLVVPDANLLPYPGDLPFDAGRRGAARLSDGVADGRRQGPGAARGRPCSCRLRAAACRAPPSRSPSCTARASWRPPGATRRPSARARSGPTRSSTTRRATSSPR